MLNYNIQVKVIKDNGEVLNLTKYNAKNIEKLTNVNFLIMKHKTYGIAKQYNGYTAIYKVEKINDKIIETELWNDKPTACNSKNNNNIAQYMYEIAGTLE